MNYQFLLKKNLQLYLSRNFYIVTLCLITFNIFITMDLGMMIQTLAGFFAGYAFFEIEYTDTMFGTNKIISSINHGKKTHVIIRNGIFMLLMMFEIVILYFINKCIITYDIKSVQSESLLNTMVLGIVAYVITLSIGYILRCLIKDARVIFITLEIYVFLCTIYSSSYFRHWLNPVYGSIPGIKIDEAIVQSITVFMVVVTLYTLIFAASNSNFKIYSRKNEKND